MEENQEYGKTVGTIYVILSNSGTIYVILSNSFYGFYIFHTSLYFGQGFCKKMKCWTEIEPT